MMIIIICNDGNNVTKMIIRRICDLSSEPDQAGGVEEDGHDDGMVPWSQIIARLSDSIGVYYIFIYNYI